MDEPRPTVYRRVLTVAGSDSGGGAGIQADLKTFAALGCYGMSAITAVTAQNTLGVSAIHPIPVDVVEAQMEAVFSDLGTDAVKIGMLFSADLVQVVVRQLVRHQAANIVLDPVMVAQSGDRLLEDAAVAAIVSGLLPLADLVTPNLPEAEVLTGRPVAGIEAMEAAARSLARTGCRGVLIKGGHAADPVCEDLLYLPGQDRVEILRTDRIRTRNTHGTGCTLSSAVAAFLARGLDLAEAVVRAKAYITRAIDRGKGYRIGAGHGPVHHFHGYWD